jgi:hypothetical protein
MAFVVIPAVGLVVDGGYALAQRRAAQNSSDFAALAGARIVAEKVGGDTTNGIDANVKAAIVNSMAVNRNASVTFWTSTSKDASNNSCTATPTGQNGCDFPYYVDSSGAFLGYVGVAAAIPAGSAGVRLNASLKWTPFFVGSIVGNWTATTTSTAMGGYAAGGPGGNVFPAGIAKAFFTGRQPCGGGLPATTNVGGSGTCDPQHLTPGSLNVPGGFGWLKFGCSGYGLGQGSDGGCANSKPFLQSEIGTGTPPWTPNSYGCCTAVGETGSADLVGSLPGNKASADCSYYITNKVLVIIPVWDSASGNGSNAYYHIVGFTGFQITNCDGGKDIEGVWRQPFFLGPTTSTQGTAGGALAVQLVH